MRISSINFRILLIMVGLLTMTVGLGFWWTYFRLSDSANIEGQSFNKGENGLWLRYLWYAGDANYWSKASSMLELLKQNQIKYAYFHVRELQADGHLALKSEDKGKNLTSLIHSQASETKAIAWVSLGSAYPAKGTNLADVSVRKNAVQAAIWLTEKCGFDGVQWDYEPCKSGDADFLALLKESRSAVASSKIISVATPICRQAGEAVTWYAWDDFYFTEVAKQADQIAVMCYDLILLFPWQYESAIKKQPAAIGGAVAKSQHECTVIFGLPTYDRNFIHDHCETLRLALKAIRECSSASGRSAPPIKGIALFADYTTDEKEWALYRKYWLDNK